jgi:hypothetical protein
MLREALDRAARATSKLLGDRRVFDRVQRAFLTSLDARRMLERNVGRILAATNLPSQQEVERLYDHIRTLEREMTDIAARVNALAEAMESKRRKRSTVAHT